MLHGESCGTSFLFGLLDGHQLKTAPLPFCICLWENL